MKNFNQQQGEMDNSEFYQRDVSSHGNAKFDGNQYDGRHGSPIKNSSSVGNIIGIGMGQDEKQQMKSDAAPNYNGINFNNAQHKFNNTAHDNSPDMDWEKQNGVFMNPVGKFKDINEKMSYEVDLSKHIDCVGMPDESIFGNSSDCGYGS